MFEPGLLKTTPGPSLEAKKWGERVSAKCLDLGRLLERNTMWSGCAEDDREAAWSSSGHFNRSDSLVLIVEVYLSTKLEETSLLENLFSFFLPRSKDCLLPSRWREGCSKISFNLYIRRVRSIWIPQTWVIKPTILPAAGISGCLEGEMERWRSGVSGSETQRNKWLTRLFRHLF